MTDGYVELTTVKYNRLLPTVWANAQIKSAFLFVILCKYYLLDFANYHIRINPINFFIISQEVIL